MKEGTVVVRMLMNKIIWKQMRCKRYCWWYYFV